MNNRKCIAAALAATLTDVTAAIKPPHTEATVRYTFNQIAGDPCTQFLCAAWTSPFKN